MKRLFWMIPLILLASCSWGNRELPQLGQLPDFQLMDQDSQKFTREDLEGKVWATNFIFTSCAGTCPLLTERMKKVQKDLKKKAEPEVLSRIGIVSFSVDPERDTPEVLSKYAKRYEIDQSQWRMITGPVQEIENTVVGGFKIAMGKVPRTLDHEPENPAEFYDIVHGEKFLIVDSKGNIRGYYDATDAGMITFTRDLIALAKRNS